VSLLTALNHLQIVIGDEMAFQVTYVKTEEKWTEVTSLPYSLAILVCDSSSGLGIHVMQHFPAQAKGGHSSIGENETLRRKPW